MWITITSKAVWPNTKCIPFTNGKKLALSSEVVDLCVEGVSMLSIYPDHLSHIALWARVFGRIFNFYQHNKEQVVPHVVLLFDVLLKSHRLVVKLVPLQAYRGAITHNI